MRKTSAYARKRAHKPQASWAETLRPAIMSRAFTEQEATDEKLKLHSAIESLRNGTMTHDEYDYCAVILNATRVLAESIDASLYDLMRPGMDALMRVRDRVDTGKQFALDGIGLHAMPDLLAVYDAIIEKVSPLQMQQAVITAHEKITGKKLKWR